MSAGSARGPVRVLHVLEAVGGGTSRHLVDVVRHARGVEHRVAIPPPGYQNDSGAAYDEASVAAIAATGAAVHLIDMHRTVPHPANFAAPFRLRSLVQQHRIDIVHGHSSVGGALARVAAALAGVPAVYSPNGIATGRAPRAVERALGRVTARLIAVSESEAASARDNRVARDDRIAIIPNGIDLERLPPPARGLRHLLGLDRGTRLVGTVARLVDQKAPEQFVAVAEAVHRQRADIHFVLVGHGPLQPALDDAVRRAGLGDCWHQVEFIPDVSAVLSELDVFVLASRFEGGPYTPLEAMRAGTPVVLSDVVGNRDAVVPGVSGALVPFGDTAMFTSAVIDLLEDDTRRAAVVAGGRERLESTFDVRLMGGRLTELYEELAATPAGWRRVRRSTRRLPQPSSVSSIQSPDARAAQ